MSKVEMMLVEQSHGMREHRTEGAPSRVNGEHRVERARDLRPPKPTPPPPPPPGAVLRWVRHGRVAAARVWRPWWLLGLVEIVTYPQPRFALPHRRLELPAVRAFGDLPAIPARVLLLEA